MKSIQGSCLCEGVQFTVTANALNVYQCHCSVCRKVSGAASGAAFFVSRDALVWVRGRELVRRFQKASGYSVHFCATCGSPLPHAFMGQYYWVPAGLLEPSAEGQVVAHLHLDSSAHWETVPDGGARFAGSPALDTLLQLVVGTDARGQEYPAA